MLKNDFIKVQLEAVRKNAKSAFQGHRLKPVIIQSIAEREDVIAKIATFAFNLKSRKKKTGALRAEKFFRIFGYINHQTFVKKTNADMSALKAFTKKDFFPSENAIVIVLKQKNIDQQIPDLEDVDSVRLGESMVMTWKQAMASKIPGAMYLVLAFTHEGKIPAEERKALTFAARNSKKVERSGKSAGLIKRNLKEKRAKLLAKYDSANTEHQLNSAGMRQGMLQAGELLGRKRKLDRPETFVKAKKEYNARAKELSKIKLTLAEEKSLKLAKRALKAGRNREANKYFNQLRPEIADFYRNGGHKNVTDLTNAKKKEIRAKIKNLNNENKTLLEDLNNATGHAAGGIKRRIKSNKEGITFLRSKLDTYSNLTQSGLKAKQKALKEAKLKLAGLLEKNVAIDIAIDKVIDKIKGNDTAKELVKSELISDITETVINVSDDAIETTGNIDPDENKEIIAQTLQNEVEVEPTDQAEIDEYNKGLDKLQYQLSLISPEVLKNNRIFYSTLRDFAITYHPESSVDNRTILEFSNLFDTEYGDLNLVEDIIASISDFVLTYNELFGSGATQELDNKDQAYNNALDILINDLDFIATNKPDDTVGFRSYLEVFVNNYHKEALSYIDDLSIQEFIPIFDEVNGEEDKLAQIANIINDFTIDYAKIHTIQDNEPELEPEVDYAEFMNHPRGVNKIISIFDSLDPAIGYTNIDDIHQLSEVINMTWNGSGYAFAGDITETLKDIIRINAEYNTFDISGLIFSVNNYLRALGLPRVITVNQSKITNFAEYGYLFINGQLDISMFDFNEFKNTLEMAYPIQFDLEEETLTSLNTYLYGLDSLYGGETLDAHNVINQLDTMVNTGEIQSTEYVDTDESIITTDMELNSFPSSPDIATIKRAHVAITDSIEEESGLEESVINSVVMIMYQYNFLPSSNWTYDSIAEISESFINQIEETIEDDNVTLALASLANQFKDYVALGGDGDYDDDGESDGLSWNAPNDVNYDSLIEIYDEEFSDNNPGAYDAPINAIIEALGNSSKRDFSRIFKQIIDFGYTAYNGQYEWGTENGALFEDAENISQLIVDIKTFVYSIYQNAEFDSSIILLTQLIDELQAFNQSNPEIFSEKTLLDIGLKTIKIKEATSLKQVLQLVQEIGIHFSKTAGNEYPPSLERVNDKLSLEQFAIDNLTDYYGPVFGLLQNIQSAINSLDLVNLPFYNVGEDSYINMANNAALNLNTELANNPGNYDAIDQSTIFNDYLTALESICFELPGIKSSDYNDIILFDSETTTELEDSMFRLKNTYNLNDQLALIIEDLAKPLHEYNKLFNDGDDFDFDFDGDDPYDNPVSSENNFGGVPQSPTEIENSNDGSSLNLSDMLNTNGGNLNKLLGLD